jgi:hypothetical protein
MKQTEMCWLVKNSNVRVQTPPEQHTGSLPLWNCTSYLSTRWKPSLKFWNSGVVCLFMLAEGRALKTVKKCQPKAYLETSARHCWRENWVRAIWALLFFFFFLSELLIPNALHLWSELSVWPVSPGGTSAEGSEIMGEAETCQMVQEQSGL